MAIHYGGLYCSQINTHLHVSLHVSFLSVGLTNPPPSVFITPPSNLRMVSKDSEDTSHSFGNNGIAIRDYIKHKAFRDLPQQNMVDIIPVLYACEDWLEM